MSIVAMKKKSVILYGSNRSGKPPGGYWLPQGPFGRTGLTELQLAKDTYGPVGFSVSGTHRNVGGVGQSMHMSKSGTPFRGMYPVGNGGCCGKYKQPLPTLNARQVIANGDQYMYVKPPVLSQYGMLRKKYRYLYNGQYPNYIVKDVFSGNKTDNASQGVYLSKVSAANTCVVGVNDESVYEGYIVKCGPTGCRKSAANFKYNTMAANGPYTKFIKQAQTSSEHTLRIQRQCANPSAKQKPIPVANNGNGSACAVFIPATLL
jgi:hypothetical protein